MIFGIFKDKKTKEFANYLAVTFLEYKRIISNLPKNKLNEKDIVSALKESYVSKTFMVASIHGDKLGIYINLKERNLEISIKPKYVKGVQDYKNYELILMGIYDYQGFSISYEPEDDKPTVLLLDMSNNNLAFKPTKKAKLLHEEISKSKKFFNTNKIE
tara:strand:+ start:1759 stop:2235 length:477 start_codon:yes stop_codon:yes gene_type:complete